MNVVLTAIILVGTVTVSVTDVYLYGKPAVIDAATTPSASTQTLKDAGVDPTIIKSVLMSPVAGQKTLNSVAGITADTVTFGDLSTLVALDLSTVANPDLATLLQRTNSQEDANKQYVYNTKTLSSGDYGIWSSNPDSLSLSKFAKMTMQVIFAAKNIKAIDLDGLFKATTSNLNQVGNLFTALGAETSLGDQGQVNLLGGIIANDTKLNVINLANNGLNLADGNMAQTLGLLNYQGSSQALAAANTQLYFAGNPGADTFTAALNNNSNMNKNVLTGVNQTTQLLPPAFSLIGGAVVMDAPLAQAIKAVNGDLSKLSAEMVKNLNSAIIASNPNATPVLGNKAADSTSVTSAASPSAASSSAASSNATSTSSVAGGSTGTGSSTVPSGSGTNIGLFDQTTLGIGRLQASKDPATQLLPNGVQASTTLKNWGLPDAFIKAIITNSQTFDGHHLADFGRTIDNVTFGDLMYVNKLDLSDRNNSNGIQSWIATQPIYNMSVDNTDDWKNKTTFGAGNREYTAGLWAIVMSTTSATSVDVSGWMPQLKSEDPNWTRAFGNLDLRKLPRLKQFSMAFDGIGDGAFSGETLPVFQNATLTTLDISGNLFTQLSGTSGSARISSGYPKLVNLNMSDMPKMTTFPTELMGATSPLAKRLQSLNIDRDNFTSLPAWITTAVQSGLIVLTATGNNMTDAADEFLQKSSTLEFLDLTGQDAINNKMNSYYLDNSGTQAIDEYNQIINNPQMQIWLANDPTGPLATNMAAMRVQIQARQKYQSALNDYTALLQAVELKSTEMAVTVTVTTSVIVNGQTYTVDLPYDATKDYDNPTVKAAVKTAALAQLKADHPELAGLTVAQLEISSIVKPLTNGGLLAYFAKHAQDPALTGANAANTANSIAKLKALDPSAPANYEFLPATPRPADFNSDMPSYYVMESSVINTMKENTVADAQITIAQIQQAQNVLKASGDTAGVANLQNQIDSINRILQNMPKLADAVSESDFFYVRSMTKEFDDAVNMAMTAAVENTLDHLNDAGTKGILTDAATDGKISQETADQMLAAGVDLLQRAKDIVQNAADQGRITQAEADKLKNGDSVVEIITNIKDAMSNIDDKGHVELATDTGNDLLTSIGAAVINGANGYTVDIVDAVKNAVIENVVDKIADATGGSKDDIRDQIKDNGITDAGDIADAIGGSGAGPLNPDGSEDTSKTVDEIVNEGQGTIGNNNNSNTPDTPDTDNPTEPADNTGDNNDGPNPPAQNFIGAVFEGVTDSLQGVAKKISAALYHKPVSLTDAPTSTGIQINTADDAPKGKRNDYRITAAMGPVEVNGAGSAANAVNANVAYPGVQLIMANSDDSLKELNDFRPLSNSTSNAQGYNQKNAVVLGNDVATTDVATGFADTDNGDAEINFNQVFLDFSSTNKTIQAGDYKADIDWTITSGTTNDGLFH